MQTEFVKTYRYRLMPTSKQLAQLREFAGDCRYVYNRAVAEFHVDDAPERIVYNKLSKWLTSLKRDPEVPWLKEAPSQPLQQALKDLTQACRKVSDERRRGREAHVRFRSRFDGHGNASPFRGGHKDHADANASKNIWAAGQAVLLELHAVPATAGY